MKLSSVIAVGATLWATAAHAVTLNIATVNNGDMVRLQRLSQKFLAENPGVSLEWTMMEENVLRQRVTQDTATGGASFDVVTIGSYEAPIWGKQNLIEELDDMPPSWKEGDVIASVKDAVSSDGKLYAAPFYAEGVMTFYRKDLFKAAGLRMPSQPDWKFIKKAVKKLSETSDDAYPICLRGKPGWGENVALITAMAHSYGARWFDSDWNSKLVSVQWKNALTDYVELLGNYGPPGAVSNGFNENLALFMQGKCAIWIDATVAGSFVSDPEKSFVAKDVGYATAPMHEETRKKTNWLWVWGLAIPSTSLKEDVAKKFVAWATSPEYLELTAKDAGWGNVTPGTRHSLYGNQKYMDAAPYAKKTLAAIRSAHPDNPAVNPAPYEGMQYVGIPEFQGIGTAAGLQFAAALAGKTSVEQALYNAKNMTDRQMKRSGYVK